MWSVIALDSTREACGVGPGGASCTFWREPNTSSPWKRQSAKVGNLPDLKDTCTTEGSKVSILWKDVEKHNIPPASLRILSIPDLEKRIEAKDDACVVRTAGWWDLFPSSAYIYFQNAGKLPDSCPYETYVSAWRDAAKSTVPTMYTRNFMPWFARRPYGLPFIALHLRRGDKADPQHAHIYRHLSMVRQRTLDVIKYLCANSFVNGAVASNYAIYGDADDDEVAMFSKGIEDAGCVVLVDEPRDEDTPEAARMYVEWHAMTRAAGIIQSVSHDGYSSFSYAASMAGAVVPVPLLSVHPEPEKTVYADARHDAIKYTSDGLAMLTSHDGLRSVFHLPKGVVPVEGKVVLDAFLANARNQWQQTIEAWPEPTDFE